MTSLELGWWTPPPLHPPVKKKHQWVGTRHCPPAAGECQQLWRESRDRGMLNLGGWSCLTHWPYPPDPWSKERRWQVAFFGDAVCPGLFIACLMLIVLLSMPVEAGQASAGQVSAWFGGIYWFMLSPGWGTEKPTLFFTAQATFWPHYGFLNHKRTGKDLNVLPTPLFVVEFTVFNPTGDIKT